MIRYRDLLKEGKERLIQSGSSDQAATLYLNELCAQKDISLYMEMDSPVDEQIQTDYLEGIHRMEKGEPLGYVIGYEPFYGYNFTVNESVLIPRPETEELTAQVLMQSDRFCEQMDHPVVFDVATGSGAIGITLSLENPDLDVYASDISYDALDTAFLNNQKLGGRVMFVQGDMLEPFISRGMHCDILVCNPPYIPQDEKVDHSVVDFEPNVALFGGDDGLLFYRRLFQDADQVLNPGGVMCFEMGWDQSERLTTLAKKFFPEAAVSVIKDINGKDRILIVEMEQEEKEGDRHALKK